MDAKFPQGRKKLKFNEALKRVLNFLATDLIDTTRSNAEDAGVQSVDDVRRAPRRLAAFSAQAASANRQLKQFLFRHLYDNPAIVEDRDRSVAALENLFRHYMKNPEAMPPFYAAEAKTRAPHQVVTDYIAGMTDHYLLRLHAG